MQTPSRILRRVVKIGGSLLARPDLQPALTAWFHRQAPAENWLLVGGGSLVDAVRTWDRVHGLDQEFAHWLCIDLLDSTTLLCQRLFPQWPLLEALPPRSAGHKGSSVAFISVGAFYARDKHDTLPHSWDTTSDALAALLATVGEAEELVLLKSCAIEPSHGFDEWASAGIVDPVFARLAQDLPRVRLEQL